MAKTIARRPATRVIIREGARKGAAIAKRGASAAAIAAREEVHTFTALGAAALLGYARRESMLDNVPQIDAIGPEGTLALAAFALGKFMKSKVASHVATGLGAVAINRLAAGDLGGGT